MKFINYKLKFFFVYIFFFPFPLFSQCDYYDDFSSPGDWTQVGTLVEVSGGELQYIDGAPDAVQRRVYKELDYSYTSDDCWEMTLEFLPESVGTYGGDPFPGHLIFSLSETDNDPLHDCTNDDCTGYPDGTQDAICIEYYGHNPPDGNIYFRILLKDYTTRIVSNDITYCELGQVIYVELKKSCSNLRLNIYSDEEKQNPLGDGPVFINNIPDLSGLNFIQHGNATSGFNLRELTGTVDNVCIKRFDYCNETIGEETYLGCEGDGYFVEVNGNIYDEDYPNGVEVITNEAGCDSTVTIDLIYQPNSTGEELYLGCEGDGYSVEVNGTVYDENNPSGTEIMENSIGCDSVITINLIYNPPTYGNESYNGCEGDGYSVEVNGTIYDENNPSGTEIIENSIGCDSVITINLIYNSPTYGNESYNGCEGDGYSVEVNGTIYDENNPSGTEIMENSLGCDSVITINLIYNSAIYGNESYNGCEGDGYSVEVNGVIYDENNPSGTETLINFIGCDSIVTIDLMFNPPSYGEETYNGCKGDGYYVILNGNTYDEDNPSGTEILINSIGCDSIVTIDLVYNDVLDIYTAGSLEECDYDYDGRAVFDLTVLNSDITGGNSGQTINWYEDMDCTIMISNPSAYVSYTSSVYVFLTDNSGDKCNSDTILVALIVIDIPSPGEDNVIEVCNNETDINIDTLLGDHTVGGIWLDNDNSGIDVESSSGKNVSFIGVNKGVYHFEYKIESSGTCPESSAEITVIVNPVTYFDINEQICPDQKFEIGNNTYDLDNPSGTEIMINIFDCDSIITINLTEKESSATILTKDENCFGFGKLIIKSAENVTLPLILNIQNIGSYDVISFPFVMDSLVKGNYIYSIVDKDGCLIYNNEKFIIEEFNPYYINIDVLPNNNVYQLNIETDIDPYIIEWNPSTDLSCDDCLNPIANPDNDTEYVVEITDEEGCIVTDTVFLKGIITENKDVNIDIPNIFTPNNDQSNDIFYIKSNISGITYEMYIYDRWGENIFYAKDLHVNESIEGWDGNFKGKKVNLGVYVYLIIVDFGNDKKENYAGDVLLLR